MIRVDALTIGYGTTPLQEDLTFNVASGDIFVVLGGSGSGKSTLLRHLIGLERPMKGTVEIEGVGDPRLVQGAPHFGVLFQSGALFGSMTLAQNVALPLERWTDLDAETIEALVRWKLRLVGLDGFENHMPSELSGGMRKRAGIARALSYESKLLFLDEPSAGLDPVTSVELDDVIMTLNESLGLTIVIVTHELASIFKIGKTCILLNREARGIIARGDPRELRDKTTDDRVRSFFNRLSSVGR
ncbi:MAG: phospholipid/cholesterol/gamma-HCH transport system ATP-binding protein [Chlamydiales bacterium]|jgi:phospholipid/cholesterol/gamma-HCH transport system ATP-binding protein